MEKEQFVSVIEVFKKYGIDGSYRDSQNLKYALMKSPEEIERIILFCQDKFIDYSGNSYVWLKSYDELVQMTKIAHDANLPFQKGGVLFSRTPDELREIIEICIEHEIKDWESNDTYYVTKEHDIIFRHTPESIREIISYCESVDPKILYKDQMVFKYKNVEEIRAGYELCKKIGIDFSDFLGASEDNAEELWISYNNVRYLMDKNGEKIISCKGGNWECVVPETVREIGDNAFEGCNVKKIVIPATVTYVGEGAFKDCRALSEVEFLGELDEIKESTFEGCSALTKIGWPNGIKKIGRLAFKGTMVGDAADYKFRIPDTVEIIEESAFEGCRNILKFVGPSNLSIVKRNALRNCSRLGAVVLPPTTRYFDPGFVSEDKVFRFVYGNWSLFSDEPNMRFGYENYAQMAENIYKFCQYGLKCVVEDGKSETVYLPSYFKASSIEEYNDGYIRQLVEIIASCDKNDVYTKVFSKLNVDQFVNNVNYLINELGVSRDEICDLVISGNNFNLLNCSIRDALDNYKYLVNQRLISENILRNLYFGDAPGNTPEEMLKSYYEKNKELPELFNSLLIEHNDKNKLELRDRLVYVSTMHLLDDNFDYKQIESAKSKLKYSLLENVVNRDKVMFIDSDIYSVLEEKYPEMCGIMYSLKEKMMGIDKQWFDSLLKEIKKGGKDTTFDKFYKSLTTIQHWDEYDETERLTLLKNEIVGRLLYADISLTYRKTDASVKKFVNKRENHPQSMVALLQFASKSRDELFTRETVIPSADSRRRNPEKIYSKINFILTMLELDPYSFDALRNAPSEQKKSDCLESVFAAFANESGYLFGKKEIDEFLSLVDEDSQTKFLKDFNDYNSFSVQFDEGISTALRSKLLAKNGQKTFSEFISNVICNAKIPKEMESKYLDYVRRLSAAFISSKSDDELFKFCGALDLYLRSKSEYDIQSADEGKACAANEVFDRRSAISSDARILYSLHNLNRLAHDVVEIDLKSILDQRYRLDRTKANTTYEKLTRVLTAYNDLFHMGFSYDTVLHLAKKDSEEIWDSLEEYKRDEEKTKKLTEGIKSKLNEKSANMNDGTFGTMVDFSIAKLKVQLALNNVGMFLGDRLSARRRKSLATFNYELDDRSKKVDFEKLRIIKKKLSIIRETFNADSKLSDEEKELIEICVKPKSYFFESKKLFAQEIMNRISKGFSDDFSAMLSASKEEKVNFYANNGYVAEIQNDEHGNPVLVCLCEKFNEPFGIHLQDLPRSIEAQLKKCERTRTIAYAKLERRGLTLRESDFDSNMSKMPSSNNFVGFRDYDELSNAIKSNYDNYDVPAKRIRAAIARDTSSSELEGMISEGANNIGGANTNSAGNKHQ